MSWDGIPAVPRRYVQLLRDHSVPSADQAGMASAIGAEMTTLDTGHLPMLSRPTELARALASIANR